MIRSIVITLIFFAFAFVAGCHAPAGDQATRLHSLFHDEWEFRLRQDPLFATTSGDHRYDDRLPSVTEESENRRADTLALFLERLRGIDSTGLEGQDRISYAIFAQSIRDRIQQFHFRSFLVPSTNRSGFHVDFVELPAVLSFEHVNDYEQYLKRLRAFPAYVRQHIEVMREGIREGIVMPRIVMDGFDASISGQIVDSVGTSRFYQPFLAFPGTIPVADQEQLKGDARKTIMDDVVPAYREFLEFVDNEYIPHCRESIGASALPHGREYYEFLVHHFTTLDVSPEDVHARGLGEVDRIQAEMMQVIARVGFNGRLTDFISMLRSNPRFYAKTPEELLKDAAYICKLMDGKLPRLFRRLPSIPYGIREIPPYIAPKTTGAYYQEPTGDGKNAGNYFVNTFNLKSRPLYILEALSYHESVPGHHLQIALQMELKGLPDFRRFAEVTAFVEGWALYAERLGLEAGFYKDEYSNFGRLVYEMWRACRLVVDTGIHVMGWTRTRAIDYMSARTALSIHEITTEIDRYISDPGQALAYTMGELRIRSLRARAEHELGSRFDIREFHDVVLRNGAITLPLLDEEVSRYIDSVKQESELGQQ